MMKILKGGSAVILAAVLVAGCSGDDDDDTGGALQSGTYAISNAAISPDECGFGSSFYGNFTTSTVTVGATTVTVNLGGDDYTYDISGNNLTDTANSGSQVIACTGTDSTGDFNCGSQSYACDLTVTVDFGGTITGGSTFTLADSYDFSGTGADCTVVMNSAFGVNASSCSSVDSADFTRT